MICSSKGIRHQQHIHLEIAVKFYLARETPDGWQYPGPNANDNWQRKLDHMQSHQLTLSQTPEAQALLAQHFNIDSIKTQQLIYGCLFTPLGCRQLPQPDAMATDRQAGRWLYISQWEEAFGDIQNVLLLPKPLWPLQVSKNTIPLFENIAASTLIEAAQERCTMFVLEDTSEKLFLVPDAWG